MSVEQTRNEELGAQGEFAARERYPIGLVPDGVAERYDAVFINDQVSGSDTRVPGVTIIEAGTLVEIKTTTLRVADSGSTRFGRFFICRRAHEFLLEHDSRYVLVIHDEERGWVRCSLLRASTVDELIDASEWHRNGDRRESARPPWSRFFDVEGVLQR